MAGAIIQITVLLTGLVAADAGAPSKDHAKTPTRVEVESALAKDGGPGEMQRWAATADGILTAVAADRAASETVRGRALAALAYARTSRAHAFLEKRILHLVRGLRLVENNFVTGPGLHQVPEIHVR